jgi:NCAIR mutase (PurE)-related protein
MFDTHKLNEKGFTEVVTLKSKMAEAVHAALELMPEGREKAVFKTKIEEAMFFGTKAIAGKEGNYSEIVRY